MSPVRTSTVQRGCSAARRAPARARCPRRARAAASATARQAEEGCPRYRQGRERAADPRRIRLAHAGRRVDQAGSTARRPSTPRPGTETVCSRSVSNQRVAASTIRAAASSVSRVAVAAAASRATLAAGWLTASDVNRRRPPLSRTSPRQAHRESARAARPRAPSRPSGGDPSRGRSRGCARGSTPDETASS